MREHGRGIAGTRTTAVYKPPSPNHQEVSRQALDRMQTGALIDWLAPGLSKALAAISESSKKQLELLEGIRNALDASRPRVVRLPAHDSRPSAPPSSSDTSNVAMDQIVFEVSEGASLTEVPVRGEFPDHLFAGALIHFITGTNKGYWAVVDTNVKNHLILTQPLPRIPAAGDFVAVLMQRHSILHGQISSEHPVAPLLVVPDSQENPVLAVWNLAAYDQAEDNLKGDLRAVGGVKQTGADWTAIFNGIQDAIQNLISVVAQDSTLTESNSLLDQIADLVSAVEQAIVQLTAVASTEATLQGAVTELQGIRDKVATESTLGVAVAQLNAILSKLQATLDIGDRPQRKLGEVTFPAAQPVKLEGSVAKVGVAVTPSDTQDLPNGPTLALYVGADGDVRVTLSGMNDGESITIKNLAAGILHPLSVKRVWQTDTTATDIMAFYAEAN